MKQLRAKALFVALSGLTLVVPPVVVQLGSEAAVSAEPALTSVAASEPPLSLLAAGKATATVFGEGSRKRTYVDFGLYLRANGEPFELWAERASYADPIRVQWRSSRGAVTLPSTVMPDFSGLRDFLQIEITDAQGQRVAAFDVSSCGDKGFGNMPPVRVQPDAPDASAYPIGCPTHPYTLGSVLGIQAGWATNLVSSHPMKLQRGSYTVHAAIAPRYVEMFGLDAAGSQKTYPLVFTDHPHRGATEATSGGSTAAGTTAPHRREPGVPSAGAPAGAQVDLRSLPAFGFQLNKNGTQLRFGATTWNAGDSPLVIDGFREEGEDHMAAYQYFYDKAGNETGHQQVGELHFHGANHQHWHFEDFARYRLLRPDGSLAVRSTKQSWCLANTDAVDYTRPGAEWNPGNTDLSSACGGASALAIREVLAPGSGDTYFQERAGQAFDVADLPNGKYIVAIEANPLGNLVESNKANNNSRRTIWLRGHGADRRVVVAPVGIVREKR